MNSQLVDNISNTVLNNFVDSDKYSAIGGLSASLVANEAKNTNVYRVLKNGCLSTDMDDPYKRL